MTKKPNELEENEDEMELDIEWLKNLRETYSEGLSNLEANLQTRIDKLETLIAGLTPSPSPHPTPATGNNQGTDLKEQIKAVLLELERELNEVEDAPAKTRKRLFKVRGK